jgi:hypothetical protein
MTSLSFIECCHLLAIDPKTLRQWLAQAQISLYPHPKDARIKCLSTEQVQMLARLHGRVLQQEADASDASSTPSEAQCQISLSALADADLRARLAQMEAETRHPASPTHGPGDPITQRARAACPAAFAGSATLASFPRRTDAGSAFRLGTLSAGPARNACIGLPSHREAKSSHRAD